jgi:hypothetical protein
LLDAGFSFDDIKKFTDEKEDIRKLRIVYDAALKHEQKKRLQNMLDTADAVYHANLGTINNRGRAAYNSWLKRVEAEYKKLSGITDNYDDVWRKIGKSKTF